MKTRPRFCLAIFADGYVTLTSAVSSTGSPPNIDNEILTVAGQQVFRQRVIVASPTNPNGKQEVGAEGAAMVSTGGLQATRIPSGTTSPIVIKNAAGRLCKLIYPKQTVFGAVTYAIYDDPGGAANNLLYTWAPGPGDCLDLQIPAKNGISVIPSGSTPQDVLVGYL